MAPSTGTKRSATDISKQTIYQTITDIRGYLNSAARQAEGEFDHYRVAPPARPGPGAVIPYASYPPYPPGYQRYNRHTEL